MPSAGVQTVITVTGDTIYDGTGGGCSTFRVQVPAGSAFPVEVRVAELHEEDEWFRIPIGDKELFRLMHCGIKNVIARGVGGETEIFFGVVSKTQPE